MTAHTSSRTEGLSRSRGHRVELLGTDRSPHHLFREAL